MTLVAHAGHWAAQILYLAPVIAMVVAILAAKLRAPGLSADDERFGDPEPAESDAEKDRRDVP